MLNSTTYCDRCGTHVSNTDFAQDSQVLQGGIDRVSYTIFNTRIAVDLCKGCRTATEEKLGEMTKALRSFATAHLLKDKDDD